MGSGKRLRALKGSERKVICMRRYPARTVNTSKESAFCNSKETISNHHKRETGTGPATVRQGRKIILTLVKSHKRVMKALKAKATHFPDFMLAIST